MLKTNPAWKAYNDLQNEGGEGYNPHPKFIATALVRPIGSSKMIQGKMRTQADAIKFANNCLSGAQRDTFLAEVNTVFKGA